MATEEKLKPKGQPSKMGFSKADSFQTQFVINISPGNVSSNSDSNSANKASPDLQFYEYNPNQKNGDSIENNKRKGKGRIQSQVNKIAMDMSRIEDYLENISGLNINSEFLGLLPKLREHRETFGDNQTQPKPTLLKNSKVVTSRVPTTSNSENSQAIGLSIFPPTINALHELYFSTLQYSFPILDKRIFYSGPEHHPSYLSYALCCIATRFSNNPSILAASSNAIQNRFFSLAQYEASSHYLNPSITLIQAQVFLALHKFGSSSQGFSLTGSAIQSAVQLGAHFRNQSIFEGISLQVSSLDRTWIFCLEVDRVAALFYRKPMLYRADLFEDLILLPHQLSMPDFPLFAWKLTLAIRYITFHGCFSPSTLSQPLFERGLSSVRQALGLVFEVIKTAPFMRKTMYSFHSMYSQMLATIQLINIFPNLISKKPPVINTLHQSKLGISCANSIYSEVIDNYSLGLYSNQPPTTHFNLFVAGLVYRAFSSTAHNKPSNSLSERLFYHSRYATIVKVFRDLEPIWQFASAALDFLIDD